MRRSSLVTVLVAALALAVPTTAVGATPTCNGKKATYPGSLDGTSGNDVIIGTSGPDVINGLGGNDTICGLGGGDTINGGANDDSIFGGDGDDLLDLSDSISGNGAGNDVVSGGNGEDFMGAEAPGDDAYDGGDDDDLIIDREGANFAHGGPGADNISVSGRAYGDAGNDVNVFAEETETGARDAFASGGSGSDGGGTGTCGFGAVVVAGGTADGGSGNDLVCALLPNDVAKGGSGSDIVDGDYPGAIGQLLDCGAGFDSYLAGPTDTVRRCERDVTN